MNESSPSSVPAWHRLSALNGYAYLSTVGYATLLGAAIVLVLQPLHTYFAIHLTTRPGLQSAAAVVLLCNLPALFLPRNVTSAGVFMLTLFYVVVLVPSPLLGLFTSIGNLAYFVLLVILQLCLALIARAVARKDPNAVSRINILTVSNRKVTVVLVLLASVFVCYLLVAFHDVLTLVSPTHPYAVRAAARSVTGPVYGYVTGIFVAALSPICITYGILHRKWTLVALAALGHLTIYMVAANRSALITPLAVGVVYLLLQRHTAVGHLPVALSALLCASSLGDRLIGAPLSTPLVVDRILIAPGELNAQYFAWYSSHPPARWGYGLVGLITRTHTEPPARVIGEHVFKSGDNANANFVADGFGNLGYLGVLLLAIVYIALVLLVSQLTRSLALNVACALATPMVIVLLNVSPLTAVLTGGLLSLLIALALLHRLGPLRSPHG